ncbi:MAG TPA: galactose-1-phosphate uridylyltransferase [Bryobacteraceae bacterium]|nr:galactose-1-phosphate uridylyltransferase [Bryobacteraceae bacterium]
MPELRKNPITGRWVIIATDRAKRPGDFTRAPADPSGGRFCPFCPGHELKTPPEILSFRTSGQPNEPGWTLRVTPSKFPVLGIEGEMERAGEGLYDKMSAIGAHEILIESPDHMLTLADLDQKRVEDLFWAFRDRLVDLKKDTRLRYVQLFKNHGEAAGAQLEHSHSQLIALPVVPGRVQEEMDGAKAYFGYKERCVYCDILHQEKQTGSRVVLETDHFLVIQPYAARSPFETWIVPRQHSSHMETMPEEQIRNAGSVLKTTLQKLDKALERPPYNFFIHSGPLQEPAMPHYHWHMEVIPRLTRVAGFEWGSGLFLNPTPPEEAADFLRSIA